MSSLPDITPTTNTDMATLSDAESTPAPPHPNLGGKSIQSLERPKYKSWRKKYRKMRHHFDGVLEDNKKLFKEEQKLEIIAKRLREELDGLLELCLDINQNPALPPEMRFRIDYPGRRRLGSDAVPDGITPETANELLEEYSKAVQAARIPPVDLHVVREQALERLAVQEVDTLDGLAQSVPQPLPSEDDRTATKVEDSDDTLAPVGYLTSEQEDAYLARLDAKMGPDQYNMSTTAVKDKDGESRAKEERHLADLTPRELERHIELSNPQSQHNWLKAHAKTPTNLGGGDDDADSIASHDAAAKSSAPRKRAGKDHKTLAKQVGDRAVERAREGWSPGAGSPGGGYDDDEFGYEDGMGGSGKKRARDPDGTYRLKGSTKGSGTGKAKRKRSGEDIGPVGGSAIKKPKVEGE